MPIHLCRNALIIVLCVPFQVFADAPKSLFTII